MSITINGSGLITGISAGGLPDGSVTAADLASGVVDGYIDTVSANFSGTGQTLGTTITAGTVTLPSSGIWIINYHSRIRFNNMTAFHHVHLADSANNAITNNILTIERLGYNGTANINQLHSFMIDVANGNTTFDVNVRSYIINRTTSDFYLYSDSNGRQGVNCFKIAESTTSGTGATNLGL